MKDIAGILVSGLCLLHCLATPVLLALGGAGLLGAVLEDEFFHLAMLLPVLFLALASFPAACRRHRRPAVMISGFSGLLILVLALGLEGHWELLASTAGAGLLVAAHWANRRLLQRENAEGRATGSRVKMRTAALAATLALISLLAATSDQLPCQLPLPV